MKTKLLSALFAATMLVTLSACGGQPSETPPAADQTSTSDTSTPSANTPVPSVPSPNKEPERTESNIVNSDLKPSAGLEFESNGDGTCTLVGIGICTDTDLVIPTESPDGDTLTLIEEYAFMSLEDVNSVTLLNYNYEVDERAFQYGEMEAVHIIGGTPIIGKSAFSSCEKLVSITFENCTPQIDEYAFFSCGKDADVSFVNCTGTVDQYAFQYSDFINLSMAGCDLTIDKSAFSSCEDLTSVIIRDSTITADEYAFFGIGDSAKVEMTDCSVILDDRAFQYASLSELVITGEVLEVGESTFSSCEDLTTIDIDCTIVTLGEYAFFGCEDLISVSICDNGKSDNTISIDNRAFQYCDSLTSVTIGNGEVEVGEYVFSGCAEGLNVSIDGKEYMQMR